MKNNKYFQKGFTLIELMVVIAIITLISSVVLASTVVVRERARMVRAQAEIKQIVGAIIIAQGEKGKPLIKFAGSSNCGQCACNTNGLNSIQCSSQWEAALLQIENSTNGLVKGLTKFKKDPWGNPYKIDANQGEVANSTTSCLSIDTLEVYQRTIPNLPVIPLSSVCP